MIPGTLKKALLDCGLNPVTCSEFLNADLKQSREQYDLIKTLLNDKACRKYESLIHQRELLLSAITE